MSSAARAVVRTDRPVNPSPRLAPPPSSEVEPRTRDPRAILSFARALLTAPERWLHGDKYHSADDGHGAGCQPWQEVAARWDVWGALSAARGTDKATDEALRLVAVAAKLPRLDFLAVANWNDAPERTHGEVLAALDAAIALAAAAAR